MVFEATLPNVKALKDDAIFDVIEPDIAVPLDANFPAFVQDDPFQLATRNPIVSTNPLEEAQFNFTLASAGVTPLLESKMCSILLTEIKGAITEIVFEKAEAKYCPVHVVEFAEVGKTSNVRKVFPSPVGKTKVFVLVVVLTIGPLTKLLALELA